METKFTPGPWNIKVNRTEDDLDVVDEHNTLVSQIYIRKFYDDDNSAQSPNAALIAAAPELYAALESFCNMPNPHDDERLNAMQYAGIQLLKKARGE